MAALFWYFHAQKSATLCQTLWTAKAFFPSELSTYSVCLQLHKSEVLKLPIVIWYFFQKENTNPKKRVIIKYSPIQKEKSENKNFIVHCVSEFNLCSDDNNLSANLLNSETAGT